MSPEEKSAAYQRAAAKISALTDGEPDLIARMASVACILKLELLYFYWCGFYRLIEGELVIGPYQGTPGCLRIALDRGVCGAAASTGETQLVEDVHAFPGHIACDAASESEIVVPVRDSSGELLAVLDVDASSKSAFDTTDQTHLEAIIRDTFARP